MQKTNKPSNDETALNHLTNPLTKEPIKLESNQNRLIPTNLGSSLKGYLTITPYIPTRHHSHTSTPNYKRSGPQESCPVQQQYMPSHCHCLMFGNMCMAKQQALIYTVWYYGGRCESCHQRGPTVRM